jgi:hypothetical protein
MVERPDCKPPNEASMRRFIARFSRPESFVYTRSSARFTIITFGKFADLGSWVFSRLAAEGL